MSSLIEKLNSREYNLDGEDNVIGITRRFKLMGVADDSSAKTLANNSISKTYDDLILNSLRVTPVWVDTVLTGGEWEIEANYEAEEEAERKTGEWSVDVDGTGGETYTLTQALFTNDYAPAGETAPDLGGAINVSEEEVRGVELSAPTKIYTVRGYLPDSSVTETYLKTLDELLKNTNNAQETMQIKRYDDEGVLQTTNVRTFEIEELLFDSWSRRQRPAKGDWEFTYVFKYSPTKTDISVGSNITITEKRGWRYLDVLYRTKKTGDGPIVKKPVAAYVHKVYESGDFSDIIISP